MNHRVSSVDIFRALTMLLMIFVNDLWTLHDIPSWLEHTAAHADGMGLADTVFPAFLFIVGLSIPFAIRNRQKKGDTAPAILVHIGTRTLALVAMGFFMVNDEHYREDVSQKFRTLWEVMMIVAFILIWNRYGDKKVFGKLPARYLQITGIIMLAVLALVFKGGSPDHPVWMRSYWWGILGLIGWAYLVGAVVTLFARNRLGWIIAAWIVLNAMNVLEFIPVFHGMPKFLLVVSASNHALVMGGVMTSMIMTRLLEKNRIHQFEFLLVILAALCIGFGFWIRPFHGISKILATPAWTTICTGISIAVFLIIFIVADVFRFTRWADWLMPAGQSTLTCYLVPGLLYPLLFPLENLLPTSLLGGIAGLIKAFLFAWLTIAVTGWLKKLHVQLKI